MHDRVKTATGLVTKYDYDNKGLLVEIESPDQTTVQMARDARGFIEKITNAINHDTEFEYDDRGNLTKVTYSTPVRRTRLARDGSPCRCQRISFAWPARSPPGSPPRGVGRGVHL